MDNKIKLTSLVTIVTLIINAAVLWKVAPDSTWMFISLSAVVVGIALMIWNLTLTLLSESKVHDFLAQQLAHTEQMVQSHRHTGKIDVASGQFESLENLLNDFKYKVSAKTQTIIEQQHKAEDQALMREQALGSVSLAIMLVSKNGTIQVVSDAAKVMLSTANVSTDVYQVGANFYDVVKQLNGGKSIDYDLQSEDAISLKGEHEYHVDILNVGRQVKSSAFLLTLRDLTAESENHKAKVTTARMTAALGAVTTNVMLADKDYNIVYMNDTLMAMLQEHQQKFVATFGAFDVQGLLGTNIDTFHVNPAHQRQLLDNLTSTYVSEVSIQDLTFGLTVNPILDDEQQRIGTVVEWSDLTERKQLQAQQQQNAQMKVALDNVSTNVMMADNDCNIIYLNESLQQMLITNAEKFKTISADFDPHNLIGVNIDIFHKNPAHQRQLLAQLTETYRTEIKVQDMTFALAATPVVSDAGERLGSTLEWTDVTEEKKRRLIAQANARIKVALDKVTTNVMVADHEYNIVYMNESQEAMMQAAADDLKKALPHFDPNNLIGQNIDIFHQNPAHQRQLLDRLTDTYRTQISVGGRYFNLIATPVLADDRSRIGTVVEWADVTSQVIAEQEVEKLVTNVSKGQLGALLTTEGKSGFFLNLSNGLNQISQTVNAFVNDIAAAVQKMSVGDLNAEITGDYQGMFADVKESLNTTIGKLNDVVTNIQVGADGIRSANFEISKGNDQLSSRTERQASSLEETAASLEELTSNVKQTADNSKTADNSAASAKKQAQLGSDIVKQAMESMSAITESSNRIVEIISVIDEIAFQTNLLALNASVEAARAGDQGRGFAVVANEVRNLAQRSAVSAKEIKELIDVSSTRVSAGSDLVNKCGESLGDILNHVEELSGLIAGIAAATNEQAMGIGEVNQAMVELDDITQQNAALSEEVASASTSSVQQVEDMVEMVSFFRVDETTASRTSKPVAKPGIAKPVTRQTPTATSGSEQPAKALGAASKPKPRPTSPPAKPVSINTGKTVGPVDVEVDAESDDDWEEF